MLLITSRKVFMFLNFLIYVCVSQQFEENDTFLSNTYNIPCAVRKDISPCTCYHHGTKTIWIKVLCQKMTSFAQIINSLRHKFESTMEIHLEIEYSKLEDLSEKKFKDIESQIKWIWLHRNEMGGNLSEKSFEGIDTVTTLMLVDSKIDQFPGTIFLHMPNVEVITLERTFIKAVTPADFQSLKKLRNLVIKEGNLTFIERNTFPSTLKKINLSDNNITTLNNTLRNNSYLEWVLLARNRIDSLDGQFSDSEPNTQLSFLDISVNKLTNLPKNFKNFIGLGNLNMAMNKVSSLDNIFMRMHKLTELDVAKNRITQIAKNEFKECFSMTHLNLSFNEISNLNKSLLPLKSLWLLNLTHNILTEFSIEEVTGLANLEILDLSFNKLKKFIGKTENETILPETSIAHLNLQFNCLEVLEGSLAEIKGLTHLNMSHNKLLNIPVTFLDGMQELQYLDVSHNLLQSLYDISKAILPSLGHFYAMFNEITALSEEPDGKFSAVCFMYLQYNKIEYLSPNFTEKNQCVYKPGANATLYVYLDGNEILCKDGTKDIIYGIESKISTRIMGECLKIPNKLMEYNVRVNNSESSPIIVTLDGKTL